MARPLDAASHAFKRDAFVDAAQRLIQAKGYEALSVQDILDEVGASKGAFYHYFGAKGDLLEAVVDRIAEGAVAALEPVAADPSLPALAKLQQIFSEGGRWKARQKDLMLALLRPWYAPANAVVRERVGQAMIARLSPLLAGILRQGSIEGAFTITSPEAAAGILLAMLVASGDATSRLFLDRIEGRIEFDQVACTLAAYDEAIERILGLRRGSFRLIDEAALQFWFA